LNKKIWIIAMGLIMAAAGLMACQSKPEEPPAKTQVPEIAYEIIGPEALEGENARNWYEEHRRSYGTHFFSSSEFDQDYLLFSAGEMPTAGYQITLEKVEENDSLVLFEGRINPPGEGEMTAQVLTYPTLLIEIVDPLERSMEAALSAPEVPLETGRHENLEGRYVGAIDGNSVEIEILEEPFAGVFMALRLTDKTMDISQVVPEGEHLEVTLYRNSQDQWILDDYRLPQEGGVLKGIYVGRIDGNFIEVQTDEVPEGFVVFSYPLASENSSGVSLKDYSAAAVRYLDDGGSHWEVLDIKPAPAPRHHEEETWTQSGVYQGMAYVDVHRFSDKLYWFDESLVPVDHLKMDESYTFDGYTDEYHRHVIIRFAP